MFFCHNQILHNECKNRIEKSKEENTIKGKSYLKIILKDDGTKIEI